MRTKYKNKRKGNRKKKRGLSAYDNSCSKKYIFILIIFAAIIVYLYHITPDSIEFKMEINDMKREEIKEVVLEVLNEQQSLSDKEKIVEEVKQQASEEKQPEITSRGGSSIRDLSNTKKLTGYRITSYHPGDNCASGTKTGSGKTINDFSTLKIGNKSVYTYKGKIVVACATKELLNTGYNVKGSQNAQNKYYFKYYQEFTLIIDGTAYDAICLDSCGAAMWEGEYRIDIFVPSSNDIINRSNVTAHI